MIAKSSKITKRKSSQNVLFPTLLALFLLGAVSFLIISNFRINQKKQDLSKRIEEMKKEIQVLEERNKNLQSGISQTENPNYWEEKLREQGYKKPGEETVVVLPPEKNTTATTSKEKNLFEKILKKIGF